MYHADDIDWEAITERVNKAYEQVEPCSRCNGGGCGKCEE
jgi:hypothetical protein